MHHEPFKRCFAEFPRFYGMVIGGTHPAALASARNPSLLRGRHLMAWLLWLTLSLGAIESPSTSGTVLKTGDARNKAQAVLDYLMTKLPAPVAEQIKLGASNGSDGIHDEYRRECGQSIGRGLHRSFAYWLLG